MCLGKIQDHQLYCKQISQEAINLLETANNFGKHRTIIYPTRILRITKYLNGKSTGTTALKYGKMRNTLHLIQTNFKELSDKWGCSFGIVKNTFNNEKIYIMCDKMGIVNWDKNTVYRASELVGREKVVIIQRCNYCGRTQICKGSYPEGCFLENHLTQQAKALKP